jgi:hypothetical protein
MAAVLPRLLPPWQQPLQGLLTSSLLLFRPQMLNIVLSVSAIYEACTPCFLLTHMFCACVINPVQAQCLPHDRPLTAVDSLQVKPWDDGSINLGAGRYMHIPALHPMLMKAVFYPLTRTAFWVLHCLGATHTPAPIPLSEAAAAALLLYRLPGPCVSGS